MHIYHFADPIHSARMLAQDGATARVMCNGHFGRTSTVIDPKTARNMVTLFDGLDPHTQAKVNARIGQADGLKRFAILANEAMRRPSLWWRFKRHCSHAAYLVLFVPALGVAWLLDQVDPTRPAD